MEAKGEIKTVTVFRGEVVMRLNSGHFARLYSTLFTSDTEAISNLIIVFLGNITGTDGLGQGIYPWTTFVTLHDDEELCQEEGKHDDTSVCLERFRQLKYILECPDSMSNQDKMKAIADCGVLICREVRSELFQYELKL